MNETMKKAVKIIKEGGLVAFPTETVYGLGADATQSKAVEKIFFVKKRPIDHPVIVHIGKKSQLKDWATDISEDAHLLVEHFWPGPLTLILKKQKWVPDIVTGGQSSIGIRIPNHPVALELLDRVETGLAAPSANRFGRISPTTAEGVREELGDKIELVLEGGHCDVGLESTIIDVRSDQPIILRPGVITAKQIETLLKKPVGYKSKSTLRVSGHLKSHYAPETELSILPKEKLSKIYHFESDELPLAVLSFQKLADQKGLHLVQMPRDPLVYGHDMYDLLRELDKKGFKQILVEEVPHSEDWLAIKDRLMKAAAKKE